MCIRLLTSGGQPGSPPCRHGSCGRADQCHNDRMRDDIQAAHRDVRSYWKLLRTRSVTVPLPKSASEAIVKSDLGIFTEEQQHVLSVLRQLPLKQRLVVALTYDGWTCKEVAEVLGISEATVRSHLRHVRKSLKEMMLSAWLPGLEALQRQGVRSDQPRRFRVRSPGCLHSQSAR